MTAIQHSLMIEAPRDEVFHAISTPEGLDAWWTLQCVGKPAKNSHYRLYFGPGYDWKAEVIECDPSAFEMCIYTEDKDWNETHIRFAMDENRQGTQLNFTHTGWKDPNNHFKQTSYCWALYLRLLKRFVEKGEVIPYELRNE